MTEIYLVLGGLSFLLVIVFLSFLAGVKYGKKLVQLSIAKDIIEAQDDQQEISEDFRSANIDDLRKRMHDKVQSEMPDVSNSK